MERYDFTLNADVRDNIIFDEPFTQEKYMGGIRMFATLSLDKFKQLLDLGYIDLDDRQNASPTAGELYNFVSKYPQVNFSGYTVSPFRQDYRVSFDELNCQKDITEELKEDIAKLASEADEVEIEDDYIRVWWD